MLMKQAAWEHLLCEVFVLGIGLGERRYKDTTQYLIVSSHSTYVVRAPDSQFSPVQPVYVKCSNRDESKELRGI